MRVSLSGWFASELEATAPWRLAVPAPPADRPAAALILASVTVFSVAGVVSGGFSTVPAWALAALIGLALLAPARPQPYPVHVALLTALAGVAYAMPGFGRHPFPLLGALCAYIVCVLGSRRLRESLDWARLGLWGPHVSRLVLLTALLPLIGLPAWRLLAAPDVDRAVALVAGLPLWILPVVSLFFALVNAVAEEITFRGVILDGLTSAVGLRAAVLLQAVAFGLIHINGVPNGLWGVLMSGVYGLLLGVLRVQSRGMLAPIAAHALADFVLFGWLVAWAH